MSKQAKRKKRRMASSKTNLGTKTANSQTIKVEPTLELDKTAKTGKPLTGFRLPENVVSTTDPLATCKTVTNKTQTTDPLATDKPQSSYPKLQNNYLNGETPDVCRIRQQLIETAAKYLVDYLEEHSTIEYLHFYHTFKISEQHLIGIQNLLIRTINSERRWLIVQYDNNNLPILSIVKSPNKPQNYTGPSLPKDWSDDKATAAAYTKPLAEIPNGTVQPVTILEAPDDRPINIPPKPVAPPCTELQIINWIQYKCNRSATLEEILAHCKQFKMKWDCSVTLLNKKVKKYGVSLEETWTDEQTLPSFTVRDIAT